MEWKTAAGSRTLTLDGRPVETKDAPGRTGPPEPAAKVGAGSRTLSVDGRSLETKAVPDRAELVAIRERLELQAIGAKVAGALTTSYQSCPPPDASTAQGCKALLAVQARQLGLESVPRLRFFREESDDERAYVDQWGTADLFDSWADTRWEGRKGLTGRYTDDDNSVWVLVDLDLPEALRVVSHEAAHALGGDEEVAQAFEAEWAPRLPGHDEEDR
jgi:hypothetical protein